MPDIAPPGRRMQGTHFTHKPEKTEGTRTTATANAPALIRPPLQNIMNPHSKKMIGETTGFR
jgi:hypothetical protein